MTDWMNPIYYYKLNRDSHHKLRRRIVQGQVSPEASVAIQESLSAPIPAIGPGLPHILAFQQAAERQRQENRVRTNVPWNDPLSNTFIEQQQISIAGQPFHYSLHQQPESTSNDIVVVDAATNSEAISGLAPGLKINRTMWPYQSYKPISWDKYYAHDLQDKQVSITSGLAAGITIGVFFAVFLLTFGCRLYSQRSESNRRSNPGSTRRRLSVSDLLGWPTTPCQPPPPYEIAIRLPATTPTSPPPFIFGECCQDAAPTYDESCRDSPCSEVSTLGDSVPAYSPRTGDENRTRTPAFCPVYTV
uniref:Uncharacterized protein n=2 Tax=Panagrolaimus sp. JU765 TaxID=591449 RepID=A0AC34RNC1_9BILA